MKTFSAPVDKAGRLVLPKVIRTGMGLRPGDVVEMRLEGAELRLRTRDTVGAGLVEEEGRCYWSAAGEVLSEREAAEALRRGREDRARRSAGMTE